MSLQGFQDSIFAQYRERVADFVFDEKVVAVFDDMIRRSVPGYATVIAMTSVFAQQFAAANSRCYDLGCSLGASTLAMRRGIDKKESHKHGCRIVAVDNSQAMIDRCRQIVESDVSTVPVDFVLGNIQDIEIKNASVVVLNYTLQFLDPAHRDEMIKKIYDGLVPGGLLILSEKIKFEDAREQDFQVEMHHNFKKLNGYSDLEISQKRKSIENVLLPDTLDEHYSRLTDAGFEQCYLWFECFNFVSIAAIKDHA